MSYSKRNEVYAICCIAISSQVNSETGGKYSDSQWKVASIIARVLMHFRYFDRCKENFFSQILCEMFFIVTSVERLFRAG